MYRSVSPFIIHSVYVVGGYIRNFQSISISTHIGTYLLVCPLNDARSVVMLSAQFSICMRALCFLNIGFTLSVIRIVLTVSHFVFLAYA